jgi:hypothetical protein
MKLHNILEKYHATLPIRDESCALQNNQIIKYNRPVFWW